MSVLNNNSKAARCFGWGGNSLEVPLISVWLSVVYSKEFNFNARHTLPSIFKQWESRNVRQTGGQKSDVNHHPFKKEKRKSSMWKEMWKETLLLSPSITVTHNCHSWCSTIWGKRHRQDAWIRKSRTFNSRDGTRSKSRATITSWYIGYLLWYWLKQNKTKKTNKTPRFVPVCYTAQRNTDVCHLLSTTRYIIPNLWRKFCFCQMPDAQQIISAQNRSCGTGESGTETKIKVKHLVYFQNKKNPLLLTAYHISPLPLQY